MKCEFLSKEQKCFLSKKLCEERDESKCKYHHRQFPQDKELHKTRLRRALKKALTKRDLFNQYKHLLEAKDIDYSKSVYSNVNLILKKVDELEIIKKERRPLSKYDLQGDILKNITRNLYNYTKIKILQKFDEDNSIVIQIDKDKYRCTIKSPLAMFFNELQRKRKKDVFLDSQVIKKVKI